MIELGGSLLYGIAKDAVLAVRRRRRRLSPSDRVEWRARWKTEVEDQYADRHHRKLTLDVIIRDVRRVDEYPDSISKRNKISPWFKVGLMGTYHRGIRAGLEWVSLVQEGDDGWRFVDHTRKEDGSLTAILTGFIRYDNIQHIDWNGDEYNDRPHIYCHFDEKGGTPYESLMFCERRELDGFPYYVDLEALASVRRRSKKLGVRSPYA